MEHCLDKGWTVGSFARRRSEATSRLEGERGDQFCFEAVDALDSPAVQAFVAECTRRFGSIYGVVNNAAIGQDQLLVHASEEIIAEIIDIDIKGPILLTRHVLKKMLLQDQGGRIVFISSICGTRGYPGLTVYSAAKGALDAFARSLAREVGARQIYVNSLAPGFFSSEMSAVLTEEQMNSIKRRTPTESLTTADDVVRTLDYLLFEATNVTGQTIYVDGGAGV